MDNNIIEKFTTHLKSVLVRAYTLAHEFEAERITPDHLLWSLLTERGSLGLEILQKTPLTEEKIRRAIAEKQRAARATGSEKAGLPALDDSTKRVIEKAVLTASLYEHKYVGTEHLLSAIVQLDDEFLNRLFEETKVDLKNLKAQLALVLKSATKFPEIAGGEAETPFEPDLETGGEAKIGEQPEPTAGKRAQRSGSKNPALDFFATDLTAGEALKRIDPVIGREKEIERVIQILSRRNKNNPILLGDPGVGKTAIVEGLARRIAEGRVPDVLLGKHILALDLPLLVAGTVYRGEFEGRLKQVIEEIKARPDVILFIDEVHSLAGAGSASGSLDAANILKPALARGEIRCIGATTLPEYKKSIESDPALDRRFQPVSVLEPSAEEARAIVAGVRRYYEDFHSVKITDEALEAAVRFGARHLPDRTFPDKALDLVDEAAAAARIKAGAGKGARLIRERRAELAKLREQKSLAVRAERFEEALATKAREAEIETEIKKLEQGGAATAFPAAEIGAPEIAAVVSAITGVPIASVMMSQTGELADLPERLGRKIIGQDRVLVEIANHVRRARAGFRNPNRPLGSFLFLGPSGVGKTSLANILAEEVFADPKAVIRLDMSEFGESFTVSKILGAPAGYIGYREGTRLTDLIKRRPYAVVLFDEIEKAHPDVLNVLLQILEEGRLADATGKVAHFNQALIILTSNVGSERFRRGALGFANDANGAELAADLKKEARNSFRPELVNRLDKILVFNPLSEKKVALIVKKQIAELNRELGNRARVEVTAAAATALAKQCRYETEGARAVRQVIQEKIETPLAEKLLVGEEKIAFRIDARKGELVYNINRKTSRKSVDNRRLA